MFKRPGTNYIRTICLLSIITARITYNNSKDNSREMIFSNNAAVVFSLHKIFCEGELAEYLKGLDKKNTG